MGLFDFFRKKKTGNGSGGHGVEAEPTRHCFVLSARAEPGDLSGAGEVVARILGPGHTVEISEDNVAVNRGEEFIGLIAHIPMPIPEDEAAQNASHNFLWPNGEEEAGRHQSHVIVTGPLGVEATPVQSAIAVSRLALVALELFDGIGVYWGNGSITNSREVFQDLCAGMCEEHVPVPAWMRFQLARGSDGDIGLYTVGMKQFGLMDIECDRSPMEVEDLIEFDSNIAHYLIQSGPIIADGNTVGGTEEQRILVRHEPSMIDEDRLVYKLVFEG